MEKEILEIIKDKDHYQNSVQIADNAKGEPSVTVKARSDASAEEAGIAALKEYKRVKEELKK